MVGVESGGWDVGVDFKKSENMVNYAICCYTREYVK